MQHELGFLFTEALPTFTGLRGTSQVIQQSVGDIAGLQQFCACLQIRLLLEKCRVWGTPVEWTSN